MEETKPISLYQLSLLIQDTFESEFALPYWVVAEIHSLRVNRTSGHVYLDLIEKSDNSDTILAQMRAAIWASKWPAIKNKFEEETERALEAGMKVLIYGFVKYHPHYGLSFHIYDIDPSYTLGDMERRRKEILMRLENEGVIDMNKDLEMPLVPQTIAVISSPTAAGYEDFVNQLEKNKYGFKFYHKLFPAIMQGENTTESVIAALERIYEYEDIFDVVVIIRGGGAKSDLSAFDSYELAANVAQFPLPVITGIGHTRDESVTDVVAHLSLKTPTAVANFFIEKALEFYSAISDGYQQVKQLSAKLIETEKNKLVFSEKQLSFAASSFLSDKKMELNRVQTALIMAAQRTPQLHWAKLTLIKNKLQTLPVAMLDNQKADLQMMLSKFSMLLQNRVDKEKSALERMKTFVEQNDPKLVLSRGYSVTRINGKAVTSATEVSEGDIVETELFDGKIISEVKNKTKDQ